MKKIVFLNQEEIQVEEVLKVGDLLKISVKTSDIQSVVSAFGDNPAATKLMRFYIGTDLMSGYKGYTRLSQLVYTPSVLDSIDYSVEDAASASGFLESYADVVTVYMEKGYEAPEDAGLQSSLVEDVEALKEDMAAINAALGGGENAN